MNNKKKFIVDIHMLTESYQAIEKYLKENKRRFEINSHSNIKISRIKHIGDRTEIKININDLVIFHTFLVEKKVTSWKKSYLDCDNNDMANLFDFVLSTNNVVLIDYLIANNFLLDADHKDIVYVFYGFMGSACFLCSKSTIVHLISKNKISVDLARHMFFIAIKRNEIDIIKILLEKIKYENSYLCGYIKDAIKHDKMDIIEALINKLDYHDSQLYQRIRNIIKKNIIKKEVQQQLLRVIKNHRRCNKNILDKTDARVKFNDVNKNKD